MSDKEVKRPRSNAKVAAHLQSRKAATNHNRPPHTRLKRKVLLAPPTGKKTSTSPPKSPTAVILQEPLGHPRTIEIDLADIEVGPGLRHHDEAAIRAMAQPIEDHGQLAPVLVAIAQRLPTQTYKLVFGRLRVLAVLRRAGLLVEKADRLGLAQKDVQLAQPGGKQPHDKGVSRHALLIGTDRDTYRRAVLIANIVPEAKERAVALDLENNQSALLEIASVEAELQAENAQAIAAGKKRAPQLPSEVKKPPHALPAMESSRTIPTRSGWFRRQNPRRRHQHLLMITTF